MNQNLTDLTVIVDRSGSMAACREQAQSGINALIADQKGQDGQCNFSLVQFDNHTEVVNDCVPISNVGEYTLQPRGGTALLDAIGTTINRIGNRLSNMLEADRPGLVIVAIVTDGQEWASREFSLDQIKTKIQSQTNNYNWQFTFLGADASAFDEAAAMGIKSAAVYKTANADHAFRGVSGNTSRMRKSASQGLQIVNSYSSNELRAMSE